MPTSGDSLPRADDLSRPGIARQYPVFFGPNGIRAGWRLLMFVALSLGIGVAVGMIPPVRHVLHSLQVQGSFTPVTLFANEGFMAAALLPAAAIMAWIEKRSFSDYGFPLNQAFGKLFWLGLPVGFVALTVLMGAIAALHGYSPGGLAISGRDALKYGLVYAVGFLLVGIVEEFSFRGYLQSTLASGIGFWPAAVVLAAAFGGLHLGNPGEAKLGALMAGGFGLVAAFSLRRTGNLWFAIAMHASWDWGQNFLYSVPDSGLLVQGHLLNSTFHGATWLTGGSVGPEGSLLVFPVLLLWALAIHFQFPPKSSAA